MSVYFHDFCFRKLLVTNLSIWVFDLYLSSIPIYVKFYTKLLVFYCLLAWYPTMDIICNIRIGH